MKSLDQEFSPKQELLSQFKRFIFAVSVISLSFSAIAEVPKWEIIKEKSNISFTATQNNAPVSGEFKKFDGEIHFDSAQLSLSNVTIVVYMDSVSTSYPDIANTLKTAEWFDVKTFPKGVFKATSINKVGENAYQAKGTLSLRDKTANITLPFEITQVSATTSIAKGNLVIQRSTFGIGRGEWASTNEIKDDVTIHFSLAATKK
jgi:polyisoprenoid-binding protein YceI